MIAYFGTGLLGSGFVQAMLERGESVNVWNRTFAKAKALEADGAHAFEDPAQAARGATRIHLTVSDDAAVDDVLERAAPGIERGTIIIDHTTITPDGIPARVARWRERGVTYLHAPVFMQPKMAREATGTMLISGDRNAVATVTPELEKMTGKLVDLGPDPARAAAFKLFGNMEIVFVLSGAAEVYKFAASLGIDPKDAATLWDTFNPAPQLTTRGKRMAAGNFSEVSWSLAMGRKDIRLMLESARKHGATLPALEAVAAKFDRAIEAGHGDEDIAAIGYDAVPAQSVR